MDAGQPLLQLNNTERVRDISYVAFTMLMHYFEIFRLSTKHFKV